MSKEPFVYTFVPNTSGAPGVHCTYCPKKIHEQCGESCSSVYRALEIERQEDGVIVKDTSF